MSSPLIQEKGSPEELASDFEFDMKICKYMLNQKMKRLKDFGFWCSESGNPEDEIKSFVAEIRTMDEKDRAWQVSKVRQAWTAISDFLMLVQSTPNTGEAELEDMLKAEELDKRKLFFFGSAISLTS